MHYLIPVADEVSSPLAGQIEGPAPDPVQFSAARAQVIDSLSTDRAFDLIYHLCNALYDHGLTATSAVLEDALDTFLAESKRQKPIRILDENTCPPQAGERVRRAIARMHALEAEHRRTP